MLPTEVFSDAVAFLCLFDLSALAVANSLLSSVAIKSSTIIRWEEFPSFRFGIDDELLVVTKLDGLNGSTEDADEDYPGGMQRVTSLTFPNEPAMAEFLAAALPNCIFEEVHIFFQGKHLLDAIGRVADSFIVEGTLFLSGYISRSDSLELGRKFRKVKALLLNRTTSDDEANEIADFYRGSGIEELQYYRPGEGTLMKIALF